VYKSIVVPAEARASTTHDTTDFLTTTLDESTVNAHQDIPIITNDFSTIDGGIILLRNGQAPYKSYVGDAL
jgi:hypothetical protein